MRDYGYSIKRKVSGKEAVTLLIVCYLVLLLFGLAWFYLSR